MLSYSSHLIQILDISVINSLKKKYSQKDETIHSKWKIDKDFNTIHIYVKDYLDYFANDQNKILLDIKSFGYEIFEKMCSNQGHLCNYTMLIAFGKYVSNALVKCPNILKYTFSKFQSDRTQRYKSKIAKTDKIIKILKAVPEKIYLDTKKLVKEDTHLKILMANFLLLILFHVFTLLPKKSFKKFIAHKLMDIYSIS